MKHIFFSFSKYLMIVSSFIFLISFTSEKSFAQGSWVSKVDLPTARAALSASVVNDTIYVMGGFVNGTPWGGPAIPKMEVYDPTKDTWDTTKAQMPWGRNSLANVTINGKIYALGGQSLIGTTAESSVMIYYPQTDIWDTLTTVMPEPRSGLSAAVVNDKIYVIGGWNFSTPKYRASVFEYDPATNIWDTTKADMPTPRAYLATCVVNNKIYAFGGINNDVTYDGLNVLEIYDPLTDTWDITKAVMPAPRIYLEADAVDSLIYIFGGSDNPNNLPDSIVWEYNPAFDVYRKVASMPLGVMHAASGEVGGKIYNFGGLETAITFPFIASSKAFEFTPPITWDVPDDAPSIQAAIDSCRDGDRVLVADGMYFENINFKGKKITVASHYILDEDTSHINNTIIDGSQSTNPDSGSVVYFVSGEDTNSVLSGFTITGGTGTGNFYWTGEWGKGGGGILIGWSGAKIEKNKIINNHLTETGNTPAGGIAIAAYGEVGDYLVIRDNLISENTVTAAYIVFGTVYWAMKETTIFERNVVSANINNADYAFGGGITVLGHSFQGAYFIRNNIIKNNTLNGTSVSLGGGLDIANCSPQVTNNIITGNSSKNGGGVNVRHTTFYTGIPNPLFINNTITNNRATDYGGGIFVHGSSQAAATVINTILWGNSAPSNPQIFVEPGAHIIVHYSDIQDTTWPGIHNIDADPLFTDTVLYELSQSSLCVGAGIDSLQISRTWYHAPPFDYDGDPRPNPIDEYVDMGAQESPYANPTGIEKEDSDKLPKTFSLQQNYPNPFNPSTNIEFTLPYSEFVTLKIFNILGQEVATLVSEKLTAGSYKYDWDVGDLASGVYLYKLQAGKFAQTRKLILIK